MAARKPMIRVAYTKTYGDNYDSVFRRKVTLRYPIRIAGSKMFERGLEVRLATLAEVRRSWPFIQFTEGSDQVGVWFPGFDYPTFVHKSQLILE